MECNYKDLLGKPFVCGGRGPDAYDCYGLFMEVCRRIGREIPEYGKVLTDDIHFIEAKIKIHKSNFTHIINPILGDAALFWTERPRIADHIGAVLDYKRFLHVRQRGGVQVGYLDHFFWRPRLMGFYRYGE